MPQHEKENARSQKDVQKRYQLEMSRYQKQIEKRKKILPSFKLQSH